MGKNRWLLLILLIFFIIYWMIWPVNICLSAGTSPTIGSGSGGCTIGPVSWSLQFQGTF